MRPALLVFDGDCGFCTTSVEWLRRELPRFPNAQPWQWLDIAELGLTQHEVEHYAWLIDEASGRRWRGADVFAALLAGQHEPLHRLVGGILGLSVLQPLTARGYDWVSAHRHQLPGGTPACQLPPQT